MPLSDLLQKLAAKRAALRRKISADVVHELARIVDDLGYLDTRELEAATVNHGELVRLVQASYGELLKRDPSDAVAMNNLGVFLCNGGDPRGARPYFVQAVALRPGDRNIHENLRIADILTHKAKGRWHDYPAGLKPGRHTLLAYFDPQGM
jgi:hypothetical protein